jgi:hypothetical protein
MSDQPTSFSMILFPISKNQFHLSPVYYCLFRYLYEADHDKFLPTIALENGPIELGLLWPESVESNHADAYTFPTVSVHLSLYIWANLCYLFYMGKFLLFV